MLKRYELYMSGRNVILHVYITTSIEERRIAALHVIIQQRKYSRILNGEWCCKPDEGSTLLARSISHLAAYIETGMSNNGRGKLKREKQILLSLARLFIQSYNQAKCKQILKSDLSRRCLCEVMGQTKSVCITINLVILTNMNKKVGDDARRNIRFI